jgi:hypothetical protein
MNEVLQELARQVRGGTLELLDAAPESWLLWAPPGTSNHVLWHAGHAVWLQDVLCIERLTGQSELPPGWAETFGQHCRPIADTKNWPSRDEVASLLHEQLARVIGLIESADAGHNAVDAPWPVSTWKDVSAIIHAWHDEARHQGEMYLLLKLRRAAARRGP